MPLLFTFSEYLQANKSLCDLLGLKPAQFSIVRDDNQELRVTIQAGSRAIIASLSAASLHRSARRSRSYCWLTRSRRKAQRESLASSRILPTLARIS